MPSTFPPKLFYSSITDILGNVGERLKMSLICIPNPISNVIPIVENIVSILVVKNYNLSGGKV